MDERTGGLTIELEFAYAHATAMLEENHEARSSIRLLVDFVRYAVQRVQATLAKSFMADFDDDDDDAPQQPVAKPAALPGAAAAAATKVKKKSAPSDR